MPVGAAGSAVASLLEREQEVEDLQGAVTDAAEGRGGLFLIAGEAGIGKTRLLEALAELAGGAVDCRWGRCWEGGGAPAYWPWRQVIAGCIADTAPGDLIRQLGPGAADVAHLAPEAAERLRGVAAAPLPHSADARTRVFGSVVRYLTAAAADRPLVVALEDLHAADEPSLRLLVRLAPELPGTRLLVVGTYREEEAGPPRHRRLLADAGRHGRLISLTGLGENGVAALLERSTGVSPPRRLVRRVHEVTDGNPFLTLEAIRGLQGHAAADVRLPEDSVILLRRRLEGLDPSTRETLSVAAVLGREFELSALCTVSRRPPSNVLDDLQEAERAGVIDEVGLRRWTFSHALYRERLYDDLAPDGRVELHRRAAVALEAGGGDDPGAVAELAHHSSLSAHADGGAAAVRYCTRAGDAAIASLAFEEAALWYGRALEGLVLTTPVDERRRYDLLVALGEALFRAGDLPSAREVYSAAVTVAKAMGGPDLVARAALGFAGMYESAQFADESTTRVLEDALAALPEGDSSVRARLLVALAGRRLAQGSPWEVAGPASRAGLEMARRVAEPEAMDAVLWEWHRNAFFVPETLEERLAVAEELVSSATRAANRERLIWAREWRAADRFEAADVPGAAADLEVARRDAEDLRLPFLIWGATFPQAGIALLEGRFADAERLATQALEAGQRTEFVPVEMNYLGQLMAIRRQQGRFREADELIRRHSQTFSWKTTDSRWVIRALVLAELGETDEAYRIFEKCVDAALASFRSAGLRLLSFVADVCWLLGDRERAAAVYELLAPYGGCHVLDGIAAYSLGSSDRSRAQAATLLGRWNEAEEHFEAAQRLHDRLGARVWSAHTHVDEATMLLRRRRPGDEQRAAELLARAEAAYRSLRIDVHLGRVADMQRSLTFDIHVSRPAHGVWSLEDDHWTIEYAGVLVRLGDSKGLRYLSRLVRNPNVRFNALDLAEEHSAVGDAERARQAVRRALQSSIARIATAHPVLGEHLETTVRSGMWSLYAPDPRAPVHWEG